MSELGNWQRAAEDLGFGIVAPFRLRIDRGSFEFSFLVRDFGSPNGMLITLGHQTVEEQEAARLAGFGYSSWLDGNDPYDADGIIKVLREWGWAGAAPAPSWLA